MLSCLCVMIHVGHRCHQNMIRTKNWHSWVCHWCSHHIWMSSVICYCTETHSNITDICLFIWQKLKILWWHHPCICQQYSTTICPKVRWILLNNPNTDPKKQGNYWTIFNEPEANNCLSIIAQVLLNYVVKCFLWVKPFWYNGFDRIEMSSQFPLKFNS